jgi:hypothetical protein
MTNIPLQPFLPRVNFGAALEPVDTVLHGAGQSSDAFALYCEHLGNGHLPCIFMTYVGLNSGSAGLNKWGNALKAEIERYGPDMIPQIGLSMTSDGHPEEHYEDRVAAGEFDNEIDTFCAVLEDIGRPAFVRIGYEFNGGHNGYQPETFRAAYARVAAKLRGLKVPVANVWCCIYPLQLDDLMVYYPGDDVVDWWGVDIFSPGDFHAAGLPDFLRESLERKKPMMIGETTPASLGVHQGIESWNTWYVKFFDLIRVNPHLKAFCYINWNWADYPPWDAWGDCRVQANPEVSRLYREEMNNPFYQHCKT